MAAAVVASSTRAFHASIPIRSMPPLLPSALLQGSARILNEHTSNTRPPTHPTLPVARPSRNTHPLTGPYAAVAAFFYSSVPYLPTMFLREPRGLPPPSPSFFLSFMLQAGSAAEHRSLAVRYLRTGAREYREKVLRTYRYITGSRLSAVPLVAKKHLFTPHHSLLHLRLKIPLGVTILLTRDVNISLAGEGVSLRLRHEQADLAQKKLLTTGGSHFETAACSTLDLVLLRATMRPPVEESTNPQSVNDGFRASLLYSLVYGAAAEEDVS